MYNAAKAVQNHRNVSNYIECGQVSAAILSDSGKIYTGICVDTACSLGVCAERNAIFNMLTNGENKITKLIVLMPDGKCGSPCGACRELLCQLMPDDYQKIEIMTDFKTQTVITFSQLTPDWWIK